MSGTRGSSESLPYRTDAEQLNRWIEAVARGLTGERLKATGITGKNLEGAELAARALGFAGSNGTLTDAGRRYALAAPAGRAEMLRRALVHFEPYRTLLAAVTERTEAATEANWIETWWSAQDFGTSPSNRSEGASAFGRLAEAAGLGTFVAGRRGHPTRIEWDATALAEVRRLLVAGSLPGDASPPRPSPKFAATPTDPVVSAPPQPPPQGRTHPLTGMTPVSTIVLQLSDTRTAELKVPAVLSAEEKQRLLDVLDLLITERATPE